MDKGILRMVNAIHREKNIDMDIIFSGLENALQSVAMKKFPFTQEINVTVDRETGDLSICVDGDPIAPQELGRIAAQNVYQIIMQKIKEAENDVIFLRYKEEVGQLVSGNVRRIERNNIWINLGNIDGFLPYSERVRKEKYQLGERLRCVIKSVSKENINVSVILSRSSEQLVFALFELEIPEISNGIIKIKGIAREPGMRSKVAVHSSDPHIDCIGACVGLRSSRIEPIRNELHEKIDLVEWDKKQETFIAKALSPSVVKKVELIPSISFARVIVNQDQIPLAIGKGGLNIKLASRLTGWGLDIFDSQEITEIKNNGMEDLKKLPGVGQKLFEAIIDNNIYTLEELLMFGTERLVELKGVSEKGAIDIMQAANEVLETKIME